MPAKTPIPLKPAPPIDEHAAELARLRDQVALLRQSAEARWQEIAVLTRMVEAQEAEKIAARSGYDRERRALEAELAELRLMLGVKGGLPPLVPGHLMRPGEGQWQAAYYQLINSTSWKITRPLRVLSRALRRGLGLIRGR